METDVTASNHPANSQASAFGIASVATPNCHSAAEGKSVENNLSPTPSHPSQDHDYHWFVIRATHGRAQDVYQRLIDQKFLPNEVYVPRYHQESLKIVDGEPQKVVTEGLLHSGLVFIRTTRDEFYKLVHAQKPYRFIKGLTPYYDHFQDNGAGRNHYLVVPDKQFRDFRTILESRDINILVDQESMPAYLHGRKAEVTSGPFAGVTGIIFKWKRLRRVFIQIDQIGTYATGFIRNCDFRVIDD